MLSDFFTDRAEDAKRPMATMFSVKNTMLTA